MAKSRPTHCLIRIKAEGQPDRTEDLLGPSYSFGRGDPEGKIRVDFAVASDQHLSREHCRLLKKGDGYVVENLSPNGTYVNGKLVEAPRVLKHKDRIEIGAGTLLEFLKMTDVDRHRELHGAVADSAVEEAAAGAPKKSILQSPWLWGMLIFYGLIALVVMTAVGNKKEHIVAPQGGPFFGSLMTNKLNAAASSDAALKREAQAIFDRAVRRYGGEGVTRGANAYYLVQDIQRALALLGYESVESAAAREPMAKLASQTVIQLESRVGDWYREARQFHESRHWAQARRRYAQIEAAIPDRSVPVRRYAAHWAYRLRKYR